jgi:DNA-binding XRE family transcriptional regulator
MRLKELNYSPDKFNELIYMKSVNVSDLARRLGTYYLTLYNIQKGIRQPNLDIAVGIARFFNMSVEELWFK